MEQYTEKGILYVLAAMAFLMHVAKMAKELLSKPPIDPNKEYVTRQELTDKVRELESSISQAKSELVAKFESGNMTCMTQIKELSTYQHSSTHEINNTLHVLGMKMEGLVLRKQMEVEFRREYGRRKRIKKQDTNLEEKT